MGFVSAVARTLNIADVHCNLLPLIQPFLKAPIIQVDKEVSHTSTVMFTKILKIVYILFIYVFILKQYRT